MRKLLVVVSFLMVASMLLSACGTTRDTCAPATAAPATAAPATAAPATTAPATAAPTAAPNPYIGSGKLDGNGIPPDFFADVNIRKGFSYAFDWDTFITDVYKGEAVQSLEIPLPGMPGYDPNVPHYTMDLDQGCRCVQGLHAEVRGWQVGLGCRFPPPDALQPGQYHPPDHVRNPGRQPGPDQPQVPGRDPRPALAGLPGRPARQPDPDHDRRMD